MRIAPAIWRSRTLAALLRSSRGSVALMTGIMAPVMVMSLAMGIEVTSWSVAKLDLQRVADAAAWAGAWQYIVTNDSQSATRTAADMAEINGASGTATRTWAPATATTTDNLVTAQLVAGVRTTTDKAVKVVVKRSILTSFSRIFPGTKSSVTVTAVAVAEIGSLGPQPCITALGGGADGITTGTDVSVTGNASLVATGCSLRSNDGISQSGGGTVNTDGVYAGGSISGSGVCCDLHPNAGQILDPYATDTALQNALNALSPGTGTAVSVASNATQTINPGTYSSLDVHGTLNLNPGLYTIDGDISAGAQATISGTGVTIVTSGTVNTNGGSTLSLTAPTTNPIGGAIPGVLLAGNSTSASSFLGHAAVPVTGVIYFPNANLKFGGSSSAGGNGCTEIIASTITLVGTVNLAANCTGYGTLNFGSLPGSVVLVQ